MSTFVLVHGAWHGGWCWQRVTPYLCEAGHEVHTPTLTGLGERVHLASPDVDVETHIQDILNVVKYEDISGAILVGHSLGGTIIEAVAHRSPERIRHLIFLDALTPEDGKSAFDLWQDRGFGDAVKRAREQVERAGEGWMILPHSPDSSTLGVTDPADIAWMERRLAPIPVDTMAQPISLGNPAATDLQRTFIRCTDSEPEGLIPELARSVRDDPAWNYREIHACHDVMVTEPEALAKILIEIAG